MSDIRDPKLGWLAWEAGGTGESGYAHVASKFRLGLANAGAEYVNAYIGGWDLLVAVCTPTAWMVPGRIKRSDLIIHTMFEAEPVPHGWVDNMNAAGAIWVPSQWCKDLFQNSGVTTPIFKASYGIDFSQYEYADRREHEGPMKFGIWADTIGGRKNVFKAVYAFLDAGLPNAELEVKLHSFAGASEMTQFTDKNGNPLSDITLHTGAWPRKKLVRWLQSLDCLIYLSGGEGLGLMPLEAAATGLCSIVHNCTGMTEYLNDENFLLVESDGKERAVSYTIGYGYPCIMAKPNYEQAVEQIRWAYHHKEDVYRKGELARLQAEEWTWERASERAWNQLRFYFRAMRVGLPPLFLP